MTKRKGSHSHYELMFESFLREQQFLYIAINEAKRPIFKGEKVKNFDFIVVSKYGKLILMDIKGKQFPYESKLGKNYWENWVGLDDVKFLKMWAEIFNTTGIIVFPYLIKYKEDEKSFKDIFKFKGNSYGIVAIEVNEYHKNSKPRSKAIKGTFNAISISRELFSKLAKPISFFLL
ncbi:MAG: HYExAFE family protein [Methanocellales archaeon]